MEKFSVKIAGTAVITAAVPVMANDAAEARRLVRARLDQGKLGLGTLSLQPVTDRCEFWVVGVEPASQGITEAPQRPLASLR